MLMCKILNTHAYVITCCAFHISRRHQQIGGTLKIHRHVLCQVIATPLSLTQPVHVLEDKQSSDALPFAYISNGAHAKFQQWTVGLSSDLQPLFQYQSTNSGCLSRRWWSRVCRFSQMFSLLKNVSAVFDRKTGMGLGIPFSLVLFSFYPQVLPTTAVALRKRCRCLFQCSAPGCTYAAAFGF